MTHSDSPPSAMAAADNPENWLIVAEGLLNSADALWNAKVAPFWAAYLKEIDDAEAAGAADVVLSAETQRLLAESYDFQFPCMLLSAFAIENALKAVRVEQLSQKGQRSYRRTTRGSFLVSELRTHDLVRLAAEAGISLDSREEWLLRQLHEAIRWSGRYPVGAGVPSTEADPGVALKLIVDGQQEDCRRMYQRLSREYLRLKANRAQPMQE